MRALWLVPVLALALTGCGADPQAELRGDVEAITLAANDGDADAVREEVDSFLSTIRSQVASGDLARDESERLRTIAMRIAENADLLDPEPTPSPTPPSEEPSPTPEPSPSEEPSPTPEPSPSEEPSPSAEPSPTEEPIIEVTPASSDSSPSPAQQSSQSSPKPSAEPSPTPQA